MIDPLPAPDAPMPSSALQENAAGAAPTPAAQASVAHAAAAAPDTGGHTTAAGITQTQAGPEAMPPADPILCQHCGRTASNGISCQGICVADSGY